MDGTVEVLGKFGDGAVVQVTQPGFTPGEPFKAQLTYRYDTPGQPGGTSESSVPGYGTVEDNGDAVGYAYLPVAGGVLTAHFWHDDAEFTQTITF